MSRAESIVRQYGEIDGGERFAYFLLLRAMSILDSRFRGKGINILRFASLSPSPAKAGVQSGASACNDLAHTQNTIFEFALCAVC